MDAARHVDQLFATLQRGDQELMIVAAHPDDDVIGAGALMSRISRVRVVYATDGAPRDGGDARAHGFADVAAYAAARQREARAALALAGVGADRVACLGVPDQQATFALQQLAGSIAELTRAHAPAVVLTHAYEGGHPDHDATAFAVHAALELVRRAPVPPPAPTLVEFAGYHIGPDGGRDTGFLPGGLPALEIELDERERRLKRAMFTCHPSQAAVLAWFAVERERFRLAARYDFTRAPHEGALLYERPGSGAEWGIDGARWRQEAAAARRRLLGD
ncbi:MAG: PIG-L deacetylase family protein [Polyangia bacterium]